MTRPVTRRLLCCAILCASVLAQITPAFAGTTGGLTGSVVDQASGAPIAGADVKATSASEVSTARTDASGRFIFISLAPDTYTVSVSKTGYEPATEPGISVFADSQAVAQLRMQSALKTIANVRTRGTSNLVRSGTTADVYSINAATQDKISALGGGGNLNSAYAAVSSVPGAVMPANQTGYNQTISIRGGNYNQVGYEFDGVPINRSFDNAPPAAMSSLGMGELQVYTGATPANSEGQGLAGYINQVIKTGTYPGYATAALAVGTPTFYHKANIEAGGASPNRLFSYYVGLGGYNQEFRYVDNSNAAQYSQFGQVLNYVPCPATPDPNLSACYAGGFGPGGYVMAPYQFGMQSGITARDAVVNFHFGIPHKNDGGRDDVQLLFDNSQLHNTFYSSVNDLGGLAFAQNAFAGIQPYYIDGYTWSGPVGATVPVSYNFGGQIGPYWYPSTTQNRAFQGTLPLDARDTQWNTQSIFKAQYQKNFGSSAYLRLYGYAFYSNNLQNGPMSAFLASGDGGGFAQTSGARDYILGAHSRGIAAAFSDQLNAKNLLSISGNYTYATSTRSNSTTMANGSGSGSRFAVLVDPNNLSNGICYQYDAASGTTSPTTCTVNAGSKTRATWLTLGSQGATNVAPGTLCGPDPCQFFVAENGLHSSYNAVSPAFTSGSITDEFRPSDKFLFTVGLRDDNMRFNGSDTRPNDPARAFWFNAFNHDYCIDNATGKPVANDPTTACPAGTSVPNLQNIPSQVFTYNVLQPRFAGTYTLNADSVLRFSAGRYVQPPTSAQEQYDTWQENLAAYLGTNFYRFGFTTPGHAIRPSVSNNYDVSFEHHFKNSDVSMKLTPFYRKTNDQTQSFYLDQLSGFTSYLNVGSQTSEGFEFLLTKGDFNRNGFAGMLSFTYTNSYIQYQPLSNGLTLVAQMNSDITNYNSYTSFCSTHQSDARCAGGSQLGSAAPCYAGGGTPDPACAAGSIANPYWNAPVQPLLDPNGKYAPYDLFPGPVGGAADSFNIPYAATLILNYKHDKLAITPSFEFVSGNHYGSPESMVGVDPAAGCSALAGTTTGDPRYPYGASGGAPFDATSCAGTIPVPNRFTGNFDPIGAFVNPNEFLINLQASYEVSPRMTVVATLANLVNTCFGGTKAAWTFNNNGSICSYSVNNTQGAIPPVANVYNPGAQFQPVAEFPYAAYLGAYNAAENSTKMPFNAYFELRLKL